MWCVAVSIVILRQSIHCVAVVSCVAAPAAAPASNGVRSSEWSQVPVALPKAKSGASGGQQKNSKGGAAGGAASKKGGFNVLKAA
jgi:hypothetical protein